MSEIGKSYKEPHIEKAILSPIMPMPPKPKLKAVRYVKFYQWGSYEFFNHEVESMEQSIQNVLFSLKQDSKHTNIIRSGNVIYYTLVLDDVNAGSMFCNKINHHIVFEEIY